jgi:two-component system, cell cycle sensor histidine kinase and response regulator CckA
MRPSRKASHIPRPILSMDSQPVRDGGLSASEYEEIFHQMAENIQEVFWVLDATTYGVIYVSPAFEKICGFPCQKLYDAPTSYRDVIHSEDREHVLRRLEELPTTGKFDEELRIVRPDGSIRWVLNRGFVVRDNVGTVARLVGTVQDITDRRIAEQLLRESEDRYRDLVEHSEDLICTHDLDGKLLSVNQAHARILGYEVDELIKQPVKELLAPESRDQFDEYLARIKRDGFAKGSLVVQTRTGERRIWRYSNTLRTIGVSQPIVRGIAHDLTELKCAEKALRLSEEKFSKAFQVSPLFLSITTAGEGRFMEVNDSFVEKSGFRRDEIIGRTDLELGMWYEASERERAVQQFLSQGRLRDFEMKYRKRSGEILDIRSSVEILEIDGALCALSAGEDITERKRTEEALKRSEADYRSLFESAPYGVFRATPDGEFLIVNPALVRMLGYQSQAALLAANLATDVFADAAEHEKAMTECCRKERFENIELHWKRWDGAPLLVHTSGRLVRNDVGGVAYCEVVVEDITKRRALEQQVRQSQKLDAIAMLAAGISHDFNTLLTGMLGYGELLLMSSSLADGDRRKVEAIVDAAVQARAITQQLLAFGRSQPMKPTVVSLNEVVTDLADFLRRMAGRNIELLADLQLALGDVKMDSTQLAQVIVNLVANARDAMPNGGKLIIKTSILEPAHLEAEVLGIAPGSYAVLSILDTGCGIDEKTQTRIFEPFFTTKPEGKGTGLGLAAVHGIIEQSGGHIRVESQAGAGTTFKIYLPTTRDVVSETPRRSCSQNVAPGCETILVVDDHDLARTLTHDFLSGHGYNVLVAKNGREAVQIARKRRSPIHLLLTDIVMPKMSGPSVAKHLGQLHPEAKVLYMTAYADVMDAGDSAGPCEVLRKPFMHHELMSKVRQILGKVIAQ